uniref:Ribonuclease T2-like n=1 Tax=Callorhinchus milii TaxID=7868 RepID=A0A4W3HQN4_CALMI|eukprot:gi/632953879/ref/XP_007892663.1/ PREDICTED: ribonuclease T2-like [Callorhinchus milii]
MTSQNGSGRRALCGWHFLPLLIVFFLTEASDCKSHPWNSIILTQHWPESVCLVDKCKEHPKIDYWTVHGLWPKKSMMCNNSWHFNIKNVENILVDLKHFWPDVLHPNGTQLWKHEWQKHGTCAALREPLNSQEKYFSKALELYKKLDLNSVLAKFHIVPSAEYYMLEEIENALLSTYGTIPKIQCIHPTEEGSVQTLGQIELCFNTDFQLLNCTETIYNKLNLGSNGQRSEYLDLSVCSQDLKIYYPPVEHRN